MKFILYIFFILLNYSALAQLNSRSSMFHALEKTKQEWLYGRIDSAIELLEKQAEKSALDLYNLAYLYFKKGNNVEARNYLSQSLKRKSDYDWALFLKAQIELKEGNREKAIHYNRKAIEEEDRADFHLFLARIYDQSKQKELALEYYQNAVSEDESLMEAHIRIAEFKAEQDKQAAIDYLIDALEDQYPSDNYYLVLGDLYKSSGRNIKAIEQYILYLKFYPNGRYNTTVKQRLRNLNISDFPAAFQSETLVKKFQIPASEKLKYQVSYGFNLGTMTVSVADSAISLDGKKLFKVDYSLKSSSFLMDLDALFEAYINADNLNTEYSFLSRKIDDEDEVKCYELDRKSNRFKARIVYGDGRIHYIEKELPHNAQGGTAILFYSRGLVANQISQTVTTIIDENFKRTDIFLKGEERKEEVLDKEQSFYYLTAKARYKGIAGVTGDAEGFFMKKNIVPAIGKMRIIVGKVRVELIDYK